MDPFPEKRKSMQDLRNKIDIKPVQDIIARVFQFLMVKALFEGKKQDINNQSYLGNVSFWVTNNEITKEVKLSFDKHPKVWDIKGIITEMNNMEADMTMAKTADRDSLDNPFTY
jgi:hypothetical protein